MASDPPLVLHVIHHLVTGGMENGLVNLINHMPDSSFRHAIACVEDYSTFRQRIQRPDVEVFALHRSRIGTWQLRRRLYEICRALRPAIVHSRNQSGLDALLPAWLAGTRIRVHSEHGWDIGNLTGKSWRPTVNLRLYSPFVSRYIAVSKDIERHLTVQVGIRPNRVEQIYNGVDVRRYAPRTVRPDIGLPAGFMGQDTLVIGSVGRIQPVKDQATLLRAFARLVDTEPSMRPRLRLAIIGDGPLLNQLRALALQLGIAELCWLPGDRDDVPQILQVMDIFVLPSLNEGVSNTVLEAMATGLPVIAGRVGGNVEIVAEGRTGFLFTPGDDIALANQMRDYVLNADMRIKHGSAARHTAVDQFSLQKMVENYLATYRQLLHQN